MSLDVVLDLLVCPVCRASLSRTDQSLRCPRGHSFDVARQGYVTLSAAPIRHTGDTAPMVEARERVHAAGVLQRVVDSVVDAVDPAGHAVLDVGAGTGAYTAALVDAVDGRRGLALDSSKAALRRAGRVHSRVGAIGCDVSVELPVADAAVDAALVVFAPRNASELLRVVRPGGGVVAVTPEPDHLAELAQPMGLLDIGRDKPGQIDVALGVGFELMATRRVRVTATISRALAADLALMGPAGFHATPQQFGDRARELGEVTHVTVAVTVSRFRRRR